MIYKISLLTCFLFISAAFSESGSTTDAKTDEFTKELDKKEEAEEKAEEKSAGLPAQSPVLQMNGFTTMVLSSYKQKTPTNGKGGSPYLAIGASNIFFTAKGRSADGFQYKYRAALESYPGGKGTSSNPIYITQNYIEFMDDWGVFQVGNLTGPEDTMVESGFNLLEGANSIDGTFNNLFNFAEGVIGGVQQGCQTSKATKLVYYTPKISGFTAGIAWTPNTTRMGTGGVNNSGGSPDNTYGHEGGIYPDKRSTAYGINNISMGLGYKNDFKTWNLALAAIFIQERSKRGSSAWPSGNPDPNLDFFKYSTVNRGKSVQYTAAVGFDKWRFATGYIHNGKSRIPKVSNYQSGDAGKAWNLAGQYTLGAYQFALGYFNTTRMLPRMPGSNNVTYKYGATGGNAKSHIVSATVDFNALQGLKFFGEVDVFKMKTDANYATFVGNTNKYSTGNTTPTQRNSGAAVIVGTKLSF